MAYAALASLLQVTEQIMSFDPYFFPCPKKQIKSFKISVVSLLTFVDGCSPNSSQTTIDLVTKIRDAAYKAEDIFESIIAKHFRRKYGIEPSGIFNIIFFGLTNCFTCIFHLSLPRMGSMEEVAEVIKEINSIAQVVEKLVADIVDFPKQSISTHTAVSSRLTLSENNLMEALHGDLNIQILEQLVGGESKLEFVPIVGMGGIGKTTLARSLFNSKYIVESFDFRAWVTVSQEYQVHDIVSLILREIKVDIQDETGDLKLRLYKELFGRKYLIVLDDVWETRALDDLKMIFPDNDCCSRIMLTTRIAEVASYDRSVASCHEMQLLSDDVSWSLFCRQAFGQEDCLFELVEIGKEIVKHCQGLPLAISVISGILSKENMTREYWEYVFENLKSVLVANDEQCFGILSLSYKYLPHHLKACFLYLGVFPEDKRINVSMLLELWVVEGFLKPSDSKSAEDVANECLQDLIDRHLILVSEYGSYGKPKTCIMHDLLRDICIQEAQKEKFLYVYTNKSVELNSEDANYHRRLSNNIDFEYDEMAMAKFRDITSLMSVNRCLISFASEKKLIFGSDLVKVLIHERKFRWNFPIEILDLVNLRYLGINEVDSIPCSISRLWNLQSLRTSISLSRYLPDEIWAMPQLKHLRVNHFCWPYRLPNAEVVLKQLETLSTVRNFRCTEEVLARMPNLRKLNIRYICDTLDWSYYCLNNLILLGELVSLNIYFKDWVPNETFLQNLAFPNSLKKLKLQGCRIPWDSLSIIGKLPNLEVLKLDYESCVGSVWEPNEEEFKKLKVLKIVGPLGNFIEWRAENIHFPSLKHLSLKWCNKLNVFPSGIAEIPTLQVVQLEWCSATFCSSARELMGDDEDIELITTDILTDDEYESDTNDAFGTNYEYEYDTNDGAGMDDEYESKYESDTNDGAGMDDE